MSSMDSDAGRLVHRLHQIFIRDDFGLPATLPALLATNINSFREAYPEAEHRLWDGNSVREFLAQEFEPAVLEAFDTLRPFTYKCDLARLCLLYRYGGVYADLAMRFVNPLVPPPHIGLSTFRDLRFGSPNWAAMSTSIIWSRPGRRELRLAIDYIIENCRTRFYGANSLYPTGPVLFGRALVAVLAETDPTRPLDDQWIGDMTRIENTQHICFIAPDQTLVALSMKPAGANLVDMKVAGTNRYNDFWRARTVYGETVRSWDFSLPEMHHNPGIVRRPTGMAVPLGFEGTAIFGPYTEIEPGTYKVTIALAPETAKSAVEICVTADHGAQLIHRHSQRPLQDADGHRISFRFATGQKLSAAEFTIRVHGNFQGEFRRLELAPG
jgi:hypothetical protein